MGMDVFLLARCRQRIGRINALFTQVQQLWTAVDSFDTPAMQPNPADGEPATLKIYPLFPTSGSFSDNQHGGSLPRRCERSILIGIVGLQARQSNRPRSSSAGGARLSVTPGPAGFGFVLQVIKDPFDHYRVFNAGDDFHGAAAAAAGPMSILKTRLSRCAHVIDARRCAGVAGSSATLTLLPPALFCRRDQRPVPTVGANTPWKRVRLTLGFGTGAASLAMKSNGSKMTCVVPSRYGVLSW